MSDRYRLIFSGEISEDQHPAVVKKRLSAVLKLSDEQLEVLFSGKPVVVKKSADEQTAARFQEVFDKAGARLRVLPVVHEPTRGEVDVLPVGSDILGDDERPAGQAEADIDTSHLSLQDADVPVNEPAQPAQVPNIDHITLAELGARLGVPTDEVVVAELEVSFTLAEVGAIIGQIDAQTPQVPVDLDSVDFELAEVGADLDTREKKAPPPPPDTSHITLDDN